SRSDTESRIRHDLQRRSVRLSKNRKLHLVVARQRLRTVGAASPERSFRNLRRSFVTLIPHEAVQACVGRKVLVTARTAEEIFFLVAARLGLFFGKLSNHLAGRIQNLQRNLR